MNGPALAVAGSQVTLAWYTQGSGTQRVLAAVSTDGGRSFGAAQRLDTGGALGRVDVCTGLDGSVLVTWLQQQTGTCAWVGRQLLPSKNSAPRSVVGTDAGAPAGADFVIAPTKGGRGCGILRLAANATGWLAAWTDDDGHGLRCAQIHAPHQ